MKLIRQPPNSNLCGQACVATIAGVSLEEAIEAVGHDGPTKTKDIKRALDHFGIGHGGRRVRGMPDVLGILWIVKEGSRQAHWVIWYRGKYYDPVAGVFRKLPRYLEGTRVTSYLKVQE